MASPFLTLSLILFAHLLLQFSVSSIDPGTNGFLQCLKSRLEISPNSISNEFIHIPGNASYESLIQAVNLRTLLRPCKRPEVVITPFNESQIQAAIHCSKATGLQIKVRSGGHDYEGLSYTSETPFFILDMKNFRAIDINMDDRTAWVGVGVRLGQLYHTIARKSKTLAFPAGTCPSVGVGGHISGGGYGMMSRKHSIASDRVMDARLIDAEGRILDRKSMGEDLFWAIRGGGGACFGILIAYKVELVVVPEIVTVFNITRTTEDNATNLVHKWQYIANKIDDRLVIRILFSSIKSPTSGKKTIVASFPTLFLGPVQDLLPIMQENFPELGLVKKDCIEMSWLQSALFFARIPNQPPEALLNFTTYNAFYFKGKSDYVRDPIPINGLTGIWTHLLKEEPENIAHALQFSPYGGAIDTYTESATPFPHRSGYIFSIHYGVTWTRQEESHRHIQWIRLVHKYMTRYVSKSPRAAYFNYRDLDLGVNNNAGNTNYAQASAWGLKYFGNNFRRLVDVKTKVDPTNFFRNEQSIPTWS